MTDKNLGALISNILGPSEEEQRKASKYLGKALRLALPFIESLQANLKEEKYARTLTRIQKKIKSLLESLGELLDDDSADDSVQTTLEMLKSALDDVNVDELSAESVASVVQCVIDLHKETDGDLDAKSMKNILNNLND